MEPVPVINEADLLAVIEQLEGIFDLAALVSVDVLVLEERSPWWERGFASHLVEELALWAGELAQELRDVIAVAKAEAAPVAELVAIGEPVVLAEAA